MLLSIFTPLFSLLVGNVSRELSTLLKNIKNRGLKFSKKKPALRKDVSAVESRALSLPAVKPDRLVLPMVVCDFQAVFWVHAPDPGDGIRRCLTGKLLSQPFEGAEPAGHTSPTFRRQVRESFRSSAVKATAKQTWNRWASWPHEKQGFEVSEK